MGLRGGLPNDVRTNLITSNDKEKLILSIYLLNNQEKRTLFGIKYKCE